MFHNFYQGNLQKAGTSLSHTQGECYHQDPGWMRKNRTHRLTCPLDKEVQVSSFLLQPYPVTNTLPWASTPTNTHAWTHTHTHASTLPRATGTPSLSPCFAVFFFYHLLVHLFTPALRKPRGRGTDCARSGWWYPFTFCKNLFIEHE